MPNENNISKIANRSPKIWPVIIGIIVPALWPAQIYKTKFNIDFYPTLFQAGKNNQVSFKFKSRGNETRQTKINRKQRKKKEEASKTGLQQKREAPFFPLTSSSTTNLNGGGLKVNLMEQDSGLV